MLESGNPAIFASGVSVAPPTSLGSPVLWSLPSAYASSIEPGYYLDRETEGKQIG